MDSRTFLVLRCRHYVLHLVFLINRSFGKHHKSDVNYILATVTKRTMDKFVFKLNAAIRWHDNITQPT